MARHRPINAGETWQGFDVSMGRRTTPALSTSNKTIDELLGDSMRSGSLACVSAEANEDSIWLSNLLIVSHIQSLPTAQATIIDTTNALDVRAIAREVQQRSPSMSTDHMLAMLERVNIIRTFDFQGVRDSIDKIRAGLDSSQVQPDHLLVIDGLSHGARILLKNNAVQGQAVLDDFFRALRALSVSYGVTCMLLNGFVPSRDVETDADCFFKRSDTHPLFNAMTAPSIDLHLHIHVVESEQQTVQRRILEIASSRDNARSRHWTHIERSEQRG